jgi:c-di-GMP-binding flagellar brake protein YcgR
LDNTYFEIGDRIELTQVSSASRGSVSDKKYGSKLLDFDGVRTAKLTMPILEGRIIPLEVGDEYDLCFFTNAGLYQCRGRINNRYVDNRVHVMEVFLVSELRKFQRRRFYRLDCMFPIKFRVISDVELLLKARLEEDVFDTEEDKVICQGAYDKIRKNWEEGTVSDLSGGGIRFHSRNELKKDTKMEVLLPLSFSNGIVPMQFSMKVISCTYFEGSRMAFEIRGEFENVKDTERETVIQYVFEEQRRRLRKG